MKRKRLTQEAIFILTHPKNLELRRQIENILNCSNVTVLNKIKSNSWNGDLTKDAVLEYLSEKLRISRENILESQEIA